MKSSASPSGQAAKESTRVVVEHSITPLHYVESWWVQKDSFRCCRQIFQPTHQNETTRSCRDTVHCQHKSHHYINIMSLVIKKIHAFAAPMAMLAMTLSTLLSALTFDTCPKLPLPGAKWTDEYAAQNFGQNTNKLGNLLGLCQESPSNYFAFLYPNFGMSIPWACPRRATIIGVTHNGRSTPGVAPVSTK